ncbi:MAG: arylamine N-acetyltransferase [Steroidobacteraceae bacterium]
MPTAGASATTARACRLATLRELQWRHVATIPFENLASLAGEPVALEPAALQGEMVHGRRGGYCYEQNVLFAAVLQRLGFQVKASRRVVWNLAPGAGNPRSHMLLKIELAEGSHIADVGFGSASLPGPLRLVTDLAQPTPIEPFRLVEHAEGYQLEAQLPEGWKPVYTFDLQPQQFVDYQMANWFVSTNPASRFVQVLMVARPEGTLRRTLLGAELASARSPARANAGASPASPSTPRARRCVRHRRARWRAWMPRSLAWPRAGLNSPPGDPPPCQPPPPPLPTRPTVRRSRWRRRGARDAGRQQEANAHGWPVVIAIVDGGAHPDAAAAARERADRQHRDRAAEGGDRREVPPRHQGVRRAAGRWRCGATPAGARGPQCACGQRACWSTGAWSARSASRACARARTARSPAPARARSAARERTRRATPAAVCRPAWRAS